MSIVVTDPSDNPLGALTLTVERGVPSDKTHIKILNNGVSTVEGLFIVLYAENPPGSGTYLSDGAPVVDERWGRFQITSVDSSGTPGQEFIPGAVYPLGHLQSAPLPSLLAGDAILADVWLEQGASSAGGGSVNVKFEVAGDSPARPVPEGLTLVGRGIDSGVNQPKSFFINGRVLTATPGDDKVHAAAGSWLLNGIEYTDASIEDLTLNQNDGASAALLTGESYVAVISQGLATVPNITKGLKASSSPVTPNLPDGELLLGVVVVNYGGGGSVINGGDLSQTDAEYGRLLVAAGSGLHVTVSPGESLIANYHQINATTLTVPLTGSVTNYIWIEWSGAITPTHGASAVAPSAGALLLATVVAGVSSVTSITDNRIYIGSAGTLTPHAATHATLGTDPVSPASIGAAPLASPTFTGNPAAPTQSPGDNSTKLATTAYVDAAVAAVSIAYPIEHQYLWTADGTHDPAAMSPVPMTDTIPDVFVNGVHMREGGGLDYTRSGTDSEQVNFVSQPTNGALCEIRWRATS